MNKLIGLITLFAGLPGLAGIYVLWKLGNLPTGAVFIVVNAIIFRGICGTAGGILLLMGRRSGSYLTLLTWAYLIVVSVLTLISLYNKGLHLSDMILDGNFASFGKPLFWSLAKFALGVPIVYVVTKNLLRTRKTIS